MGLDFKQKLAMLDGVGPGGRAPAAGPGPRGVAGRDVPLRRGFDPAPAAGPSDDEPATGNLEPAVEGAAAPEGSPAETPDEVARRDRLALGQALIDEVSARYRSDSPGRSRGREQGERSAGRPRVRGSGDDPGDEAPIEGPKDPELTAHILRLREKIREVMARREAEEGAGRDQAAPTDIDPSLIERPLNVRPRQLPGGPRENEEGTVHVAWEHLEPGHCQGRVAVASALEATPQALADLAHDPALAGLDVRRFLFLDTETTGLVGGTGTVPFLVGLAFFEDESLHVEQLFLRQLGQERPLLHELTRRIEACSALVTYNGKTFDWPLLQTRYVLNRMPPPPERPHLDLLHCARRVYKRRLGPVRLVHLEEHLLGLLREHDVEGAEIPIRYLDYLRRGEEGQLVPIIEHNAHDLISLAAVMGFMAARYQRLDPKAEPADQLGHARIARRAGRLDRARAFAEAAADGGGAPDVTVDALRLLASLARARGDVGAQIAALERALEPAGYVGSAAAPLHLALAKLYEHEVKDFERARRHAELLAGAEDPSEVAHRLARIDRKIRRRDEAAAKRARRSARRKRTARGGSRRARPAQPAVSTGLAPGDGVDESARRGR